MCGIAGYSFGNASRVNRTLAAQALLAGIAERGADAVGYAHRADGPLEVRKQQTNMPRSVHRGAPSPRAPARFWFTSATTRRATPRSLRTTIPSDTVA